MSNSSLVAVTMLSPNCSGKRTHTIDRITPHCVVGQVTAESLGSWFSKPTTKASSNYGIDKDGRIGLYVDEENRSWCSSSAANDQRSVTVECASDKDEPYAMYGCVYESLVILCADICKRNGKRKLLWYENKDYALAYVPKEDEMVLTVHRWFAPKSCPGDWLYSRLGELADRVTALLNPTSGGVFSDVSDDRWSAEGIKWCVDKGIVAGYPDGTFRPTEPLTREQAASMFYRAFAGKELP